MGSGSTKFSNPVAVIVWRSARFLKWAEKELELRISLSISDIALRTVLAAWKKFGALVICIRGFLEFDEMDSRVDSVSSKLGPSNLPSA